MKKTLLIGLLVIASAFIGDAQNAPAPRAQQTPARQTAAAAPAAATAAAGTQRALVDQYCVTCHSDRAKTAGLSLENLDMTHAAENAETWEKVIRKVRAGMMPPPGLKRPDRQTMDALAV